MAFGLEVYNTSGTVLFDTSHFNYALEAITEIAPATPTLNGGDWESHIMVGGAPQPPLVALQCATGAALVRGYRGGASSWRFDVRSKSAVPVKFYSFKRGGLQASSFGLQTYDADGNVVYCSADRPLKLLDVISGTDGTSPSFTSRVWTYPSDRKVAFIPCRWAGERYIRTSSLGSSFIDTANVLCGLRNVNDHTLQGVMVNFWNFTAGAQGTTRYNLSQPNYQFLVADVTDY